jgi:2',3'-cyclic-nucleotide 2'-phosphodiesterase (5'-nucleotidase family)
MRDTTSEKTQFVSANLIDVNSGKPLFDPYVIRDYGNMRVGVLGLLREADFPAASSGLDTVNLRVESFMDAVAKYLPVLERKCNGVVILAELATADIEELVAAHPEIDLIISTGALRSGEQIVEIGKTRVVGTGSSGYNGHWVSMEFDPAWGDSIVYADFRDQLTDTYDEPGEWKDRLAAFEGQTTPKTSEPKVLQTTKDDIQKATGATPATTSAQDSKKPASVTTKQHEHK